MDFQSLVKISRPRFWMYTVGPFLVGIAATWNVLEFPITIQSFLNSWDTQWLLWVRLLFLIFLIYLGYFIFPANLLIYGVNDIADGDTDKFNTKKDGYESRLTTSVKPLQHKIIKRWLWSWIFVIVLILLFVINEHYPRAEIPSFISWILPSWHTQAWFSLIVFSYEFLQTVPFRITFFFFSIFYSARPIRAKSKPFIDGIFNVLYIIPWLIAYLTFGGIIQQVSRIWFGAWRLWCIAMHTYSAIPDIQPDAQAWLTTTAVLLWKRRTLVYCAALRIWASILWSLVVWPLSYLFWAIYLSLVYVSIKQDVMQVYTWFPYVNAVIWFFLFRIVVFL
jgi:4-hydroxybenzoate polyprenyltransferase